MSLLVESIKVENGKLLNISLHNERMIREEEISEDDIFKYSEVRLINAMIDINDSNSIPVSEKNIQSDL